MIAGGSGPGDRGASGRRVVALDPVLGQLGVGDRRHRARLRASRASAMARCSTPAARRALRAGEAVLDDGVGEAEPPGRAATSLTRATPHRLLDPGEGLGLVEAGDLGHDGEVELAPDDRTDAQELLRGRAEPTGALEHDRPHAMRQAEPSEVAGHRPAIALPTELARLDEVAQDLRDEERVAGGLVAQGTGQRNALGVELVAGGRLEERHDLRQLEARRGRSARDRPEPVELGQHLLQRVVGRELGRAVDRDDQQSPGTCSATRKRSSDRLWRSAHWRSSSTSITGSSDAPPRRAAR